MLTVSGDSLSVRVTIEGGPVLEVDLDVARALWSDLGRILAAADEAEKAAQAAAGEKVSVSAKRVEW